ncbi:hypothetical protein J4E08_23520 [Sagittula sp. NFXS13]|uniref:hypothetical protein n=1 Tax=Sagittula sp. NFXS13 TaxID=2819095 RepID=UPI0032DF85F3
MFLELLAVIFAGIAGAGVMMLVTRFVALPRWLVPIGAGAAMLAATISSEYGWYGRTVNGLPEGVLVAQTAPSKAPWRPWTYVFPMTDRFIAVDTRRTQANLETPQLYITDLYFFGRWQPLTQVEIMIDCANMRRADPARDDGAEPVWRTVGADDPIVQIVCEAL